MASVVVFDGDCGLCNGFVAWLIRHDHDAKYVIAGSAGEVGREVISRAGLPEHIGASTIVLWSPPGEGAAQPHALVRSDAVLAIVEGLPNPWRMVRIARVVPRAWRDRIYSAIAARRSRVQADDPACGIPPRDLLARWQARLATPADLA